MDSDSEFNEPAAAFTVRSTNEHLLKSFWKIASTDKNIRLQNAEKIIKILIEKQKGCETGDVSDDLQYTVERLIKGISSYRDAARQGFSVTLTLLLKKFPVVSLTQILEYLEKYQPITGSKAEKGQTFIGRALAYEAIVRSNRLKNEPSLLTTLVQTLFEIASKRSYIQVAVINIFNDLLHQITPENFETFVKPAIEDKLTVGWQNCTPQDLWLILTCQKCFGSVIDNDYVLEYWGYNPIINQESYNDVANVLKQTINVYPVLHPLWKEIVNNVYKSEYFNEFWKTAVGENLMEKNQFERTFLIFELVKMLMSVDIKVDKLKTILSANLVTVVMKSVKINHHPLFSASKQLLQFLVNSVKESKDSSKQLVILNALLLPPGTLLTDNETRTKYLSGIVRNLFPESLVEYGSILEKTFKNGGAIKSDKILSGTIQCFALRELTSLISNNKLDNDWKVNLLEKLFLWGFFTEKPNKSGKKEIIPDLSLSLVQASRQNFFRGISLYLKPKEKQGYHGRLNQACDSLIPLLGRINGILESHGNFEPQIELELIMEQWSSMYALVEKLNKLSKKNPKDEDYKIFITLFIQIGFLLFFESEKNKAGENIGELEECAKRAIKEKQSTEKGSVAVDQDEPPWVAVLVDIFLTLLSEGSAYIRDIIGSVFPLLGPRIDQKVLQQILDVILPEKEKDLVGEDEEVDESDDEEVEFESASCSDDESSVISSITTEPDKEFIDKVAKALGPAADKDEDSDEEYLSDSEMFKLDNAISAAFRGRVKSKKMDEGEQFIMNFRMKCLDLIIKYIKLEPPLSHILQCIPPLISGLHFAVGNKNQTLFLEKIVKTLENLTSANKFRNVDNVSQTDLEKLFTELIEKLKLATDLRISKEISNVCVYLVVCTKKLSDDDNSDDEDAWYAGAFEKLLKEYFENVNSHINQEFFTKLFIQCPEAASEVLESLTNYAFSEKLRLFQRTKALKFLHTAANSITQAKLEICTNKKYWSTMWSSLMPRFVEALKEMSKDMKLAYMFELLSSALTLLQIRKNLTNNIDVSNEFSEAIKNVQNTKLDQRIRKTLKDLKKLLGIKTENNPTELNGKRKNSESDESKIPNKTVKIEDSLTILNGNMHEEDEIEADTSTNTPTKKKKNKKNKQKNKGKEGNLLLVNGGLSSESTNENETNVSNPKIKKKKKIKKSKAKVNL